MDRARAVLSTLRIWGVPVRQTVRRQVSRVRSIKEGSFSICELWANLIMPYFCSTVTRLDYSRGLLKEDLFPFGKRIRGILSSIAGEG